MLKCLETNPDNRIKKANHINWHLRNYLNKKSDTSIDLTRRNEYNLDWLASFINEVIIKIIFNYGEYPDFDSVQIWITEEFKSAIEDNAFIKEIHFSNLIFRLHGVKKIEYYKGISLYLLYKPSKCSKGLVLQDNNDDNPKKILSGGSIWNG